MRASVAVFIGVACAGLAGCGQYNDESTLVRQRATESDIEAEIHRMAADFLAREPMRGFMHDMPLSTAYYWQDRMVTSLGASLGPVVGYKTGGHDPGPGFPVFPLNGIRGAILEGMLRNSGDVVGLSETRRGFLEADVAFRVGSDTINTARTDLELLAGLDAFVPMAEVPDPHYVDGSRTINGTIAANMGSRYSFVGDPVRLEPTAEWLRRINSFTFAVHDENGREVDRGQIEGWYRPIDVIRWLRDHLRESGKRLEPGQLLSLGNIGIIRQLHEGSPRGPAYPSNEFTLSYYGLGETPPQVTIRVDRAK